MPGPYAFPTNIAAGNPGHVEWGNNVGRALNDADPAPVPNVFAERDSAGRTQFADPAAPQDAATKGYVDSGMSKILAGNGFVALGDSISTADTAATGGGGYGAAWPHLACALSGQRLAFRGNAGVAGERSDQILARVPNVVALGANIVVVMAGVNDITQGISFSAWSGNIKAIVAQLRASGIRPVLATLPPRSTSTYLAQIIQWNAWLKAYARQHNLDLLDFFSVLVDPLTGLYKAGWTVDGLHPSQTAHVQIANYVVSQLRTSAFTPLSAQVGTGDASNLITNPLLAGSGTPAGWATSGSAGSDYVEGLVTDPDFLGQAWQVAYTNTAAANVFREFKQAAGVTSGWSAGDTILVSCRAKVKASNVAAPNTVAGLIIRVQRLGAGTVYYAPVSGDATVHGSALFQFEMVVPAGATSLLMDTIVGNMPAGSSFTAMVGEFAFYNLTTGALLAV